MHAPTPTCALQIPAQKILRQSRSSIRVRSSHLLHLLTFSDSIQQHARPSNSPLTTVIEMTRRTTNASQTSRTSPPSPNASPTVSPRQYLLTPLHITCPFDAWSCVYLPHCCPILSAHSSCPNLATAPPYKPRASARRQPTSRTADYTHARAQPHTTECPPRASDPPRAHRPARPRDRRRQRPAQRTRLPCPTQSSTAWSVQKMSITWFHDVTAGCRE